MFSRIAAAYALLDGVRRLLVNLLFLLTLVTLAVVFWVASEAPNLPKGTLLRIDLVGEVKESGPAEPSFMLSMFGQDSFEENTRLADVVDALDRAAHDDRIAGVVLRVDDLAGAGMASIREIGAAIDRYRQTIGHIRELSRLQFGTPDDRIFSNGCLNVLTHRRSLCAA